MSIVFRHAEKTDRGLKREENQDALISIPEHGVFCIADGMGGMSHGKRTSESIIATLGLAFAGKPYAGYIKTLEMTRKALEQANERVRDFMARTGEKTGSTVVTIVLNLDGRGATLLYAGDSRCYQSRKGDLVQISHDHSMAAVMGKDEKDIHPEYWGVVTRGIGLSDNFFLETIKIVLNQGDVLLLCSDGLSKMISDKEISQFLSASGDQDTALVVCELVNAANAAGGRDNISVIVIRLDQVAGSEAEESITATDPGQGKSPLDQSEPVKDPEPGQPPSTKSAFHFKGNARYFVYILGPFLILGCIFMIVRFKNDPVPMQPKPVALLPDRMDELVSACLRSGEWKDLADLVAVCKEDSWAKSRMTHDVFNAWHKVWAEAVQNRHPEVLFRQRAAAAQAFLVDTGHAPMDAKDVEDMAKAIGLESAKKRKADVFCAKWYEFQCLFMEAENLPPDLMKSLNNRFPLAPSFFSRKEKS